MAVLCNDLSTAYQGFVFDAPHTGTNIWKGNKMQTLARGFVLSNNGQIGQQGSAGNPIDNQWNGSWTGTNYGTYTADNSTYASNSPLYVRQTGAQYYPPNNYGNPQIQSYFGGANVYTTTGSYSCGGGGGGGARMMSPGSEDSDENFGNNNFAKLLNSEMLNETEYIEATANYRFLLQNDSVRNSDSIYMDYCNALTGSSIDKFYEAEQKLLSGDMDNASAILQGINTANYVEDNYLTYFNLYKKSFTLGVNASASIGLAELSAKCPGRDGECIHAARALYNSIFGEAFKFLITAKGIVQQDLCLEM